MTQGVPVLADGCQGAVHGTVDVQALDVDFYAITGHKLYGPTGIGALYAKRAHLKTMRPYQGGGEMIREVTRERVTYADAPMRFEAGTPPIVQTVGLAAALDYLDGIGREKIAAHEMALARVAARRLKELNGVRIIGEAHGQGADHLFRGHRHSCARSGHHSRPRRRGGARRPSLRPTADGALQRGRGRRGRPSRSTTRWTKWTR